MNRISTAIKRKYLEQILTGKKKKEFKECLKHWDTRMSKLQPLTSTEDVIINFLCGRKSYKFHVKKIVRKKRHFFLKDIDGKKFKCFWEIHIGKRIILGDTITSETHGGTIDENTSNNS